MHMWSGGWVSKIPIVTKQTTQPKVIICTRCVTYVYHYMMHKAHTWPLASAGSWWWV